MSGVRSLQGPADSTARMLSFGEVACADILHAHDCDDKRHTFLSLVDVGLYSPSANEHEGDDLAVDIEGEAEDQDHDMIDEDGDGILDLPPGHHEGEPPGDGAAKRGWPTSRMKRKTPREDVEWSVADNHMAYSIMLMRKHLTRRGLEKQQEKELRWDEIPEEFQQKFRDAEGKQWQEHLHFDALQPLDDAESEYVKKNVSPTRVLRSRWAYKDKKLVEAEATRTSRVAV